MTYVDMLKARLSPSHSAEIDKAQKYLAALARHHKNLFACSNISSKFYFEE